MSNNKQSSVEFLEQKFISIFVNDEGFKKIIDQAKAMHKEEIKNAFNIGCDVYYDLNVTSNGEDYYNETYGGNK